MNTTRETVLQKLLEGIASQASSVSSPAKLDALVRAYQCIYACSESRPNIKPAGLDSGIALREPA